VEIFRPGAPPGLLGAFGVRYPRRLRSRHDLAGLVAGTPCAVKLKISLIWRILPVASISRDRFGVLIPVGVATIFLFHVFVHVGMTMAIKHSKTGVSKHPRV
jgi:hypothetical protein